MNVEFNYDSMMSLVNKKMDMVNKYKVMVSQILDAAERGIITVDDAEHSIAYMINDILDVIKDIKIILVMLISDDEVSDMDRYRCREQMMILTSFEKMIKEGS